MKNAARYPTRSSVYVSPNTVSISHRLKDSLSMNCLNSSVSSFSTAVMTRANALCARLEVAQRELGCVVEGLAGCLAQGLVLIGDSRLVERGLHVEHGLLCGFEDGIEATEHRHRKDDIAVLAADVEVPQDVVGDAPVEVGDPVELGRFHFSIARFPATGKRSRSSAARVGGSRRYRDAPG
jgi:hypothetical protein